VLTAEAASAPPLLALLAPFLLSTALLLALSRLLTVRARRTVGDQIARDSAAQGQPIVAGSFRFTSQGQDGKPIELEIALPAAVQPETIQDYVEHAADLVAFLPSTLLPVAGAIFALYSAISESVAVTVLLITIVAAVFGDIWVATRSAQNYASRKFFGFSIATWVGILANVVSIVLISLAS
jgi:hypothetical protein